MKVLVLLIHADRSVRGRYLEALRQRGFDDVDLLHLNVGAGSQVYRQRVAEIVARDGRGSVLEQIARSLGAAPLGRYDLVVQADFSAGYGYPQDQAVAIALDRARESFRSRNPRGRFPERLRR